MSGTDRRQALGQLASSEQKRLGLPDDIKFYSAQPFAGINQEDARTFIDDTEFYWTENFLLTGKGSLRTLWDRGADLYTAPAGKTIVYFVWFNINQKTNCAVFLSDGTAYDVSTSGAVLTISANAGTFYNGGQLPCACQSGSQFLLIGNNLTPNGYWIWDGALLYGPGTLAPYIIGDITAAGANYTSPPAVSVYGGGGTGAVVTANIENGSVVSLNVLNPGTNYGPTDQVSLSFTGGGTDDGAILQAVLASSGVQAINIGVGGANYVAPVVVITSNDAGTGAQGTAVLGPNGAIASVTVTQAGAGYTTPPTVSFTDSTGDGATASAVLAVSGVTSIQVTKTGAGYTSAPTVGITGGGGTGATAVAVVANGLVTSITVTADGTGYTGTPTISLTGGGGTGATAVAVLAGQGVTGVSIVYGGTGYTGTPTLSFSGGGGAGAAAYAIVTGGAITSVFITASGSNYTSPPAVAISGGQNNAAQGTLALMPFGVSGTSIETFQSRVWISNPAQVGPIYNGGVINTSAPSSVVDFSGTGGGNLFTNSDRFLREQYFFLHQSNGYLYPGGDSSVSVISNVQTGGTPTVTTFNYQNASAQVGTSWRDTVQDYGQSVLFTNANGVQGLYGGAVQKLSKKMNNVFDNMVPPASGGVTPSSAVANLHTIPCYMTNMTLMNPLTNTQRTMLVLWDQQNWYTASQSSDLTFIGTQEIASALTAWGTDGSSLFPLLTTPSATLPKVLASKSVGGERDFIQKEPVTFYVRAINYETAPINLTVTFQATGAITQALQANAHPMPVQPSFVTATNSPDVWCAPAAAVAGSSVSLTISTTSEDFLICGISFAYQDVGFGFG